jgi:ATP:corrinoid adenosyltransferase
MTQSVKKQIAALKESPEISELTYRKARAIYINGNCQILSRSVRGFDVLVFDEGEEDIELRITGDEDENLHCLIKGKPAAWDSFGMAALMQIDEELEKTEPRPFLEGKAYTREGMVKRVLEERRAKALKAKYTIKFADNIYGEHLLTTEKGVNYKITLRDFENETGYIDNPDLKTNKLGTTKHLMFAFAALKSQPAVYNSLSKFYPFVEIYLDPLNNYRITWHYPHHLRPEIAALITRYFGNKNYIEENSEKDFLNFIIDAREHQHILVRPEVEEKVKKAWDLEMLALAKKEEQLDFSLLKSTLFPYQQEGVAFATFRDGAIIADEMGLGKTIQAIATAVMKKKLFGFRRTLIICPASLKEQWKQEIEKFSHEKAVIADGFPEQRADTYRNSDAYFVIVNYETVLRDWREMNRMETDFIILDEAQKIKNFSTITAQSIKLLEKKHALVITGTPIENRLIDLYSIVQFIDPQFLAPLWEFSYQHCYFDESKADKITGYYNLQQLNERLKPILIRREKRRVIKELPQVTEITVPVEMHFDQASYHANYARGIASILHKKFISPFDLQKLMLLMTNMRMVCDSTFLIDKESYISPKLHELKHILLEKLDLKNNKNKVIIFSEWVTMLHLIGKLLHECGIGFAQLSGQVAIKNRDKLVKKFENDPDCQVFLSTEAGGSGLNLQVADTVINFELPWNPAKKNQRIGRIDRLGQLSKHLTVINFITKGSIETKIASGLTLKQNLFDGVLNNENGPDVVDFSASGKAQFLKELEEVMDGFVSVPAEQDEENIIQEEIEQVEETLQDIVADENSITAPANEAIEPAEIMLSADQQEKIQTMEKVMNQGMEFLSGMFKMATGKDLGLEGQKMEIDKANGEIVMRFKMPQF